MKKTGYILAAACAAPFVLPAPAGAGSGIIGFVTAESDYGNGTVRGPVRNGPYSLQVQLPGGNWVDCKKSGLIFRRDRPCSETLRMESVDFWESQPSFRHSNR